MERPTKACFACGSDNWWLTPDGHWFCGKCHPNPNPGSNPGEEGPNVLANEPPSEPPSYALEILALRDRVIKGNDKLSKVRFQIQEMEEGEEKEYQWDRWNEAQERLHHLCLELKAKGYHDCLYIENGKKTKSCLSNPEGSWCQVCPSSVSYWAQELMKLPGPNVPRVKQPEFVPGHTGV